METKESWVAIFIFISDNIEFKTTIILRDKEGHYIKMKGSTKQG